MMTTQPQSPSEQEIEQGLISVLETWFDLEYQGVKGVVSVKQAAWETATAAMIVFKQELPKLIAQAADKREQEVLEAARAEDAKAAEEYRTSWLMRWTVYDEYIGRRLGRLNRQGKPAEGNK